MEKSEPRMLVPSPWEFPLLSRLPQHLETYSFGGGSGVGKIVFDFRKGLTLQPRLASAFQMLG